jgi:hypothetical protein
MFDILDEKIKHDDAVETSRRERIAMGVAVAVLSILCSRRNLPSAQHLDQLPHYGVWISSRLPSSGGADTRTE